MTFIAFGDPPESQDIYPAWPTHFIKAVETAVEKAWETVVKTMPDIIGSQDEDKITNAIKLVLVQLWKSSSVSTFGYLYFSLPTRDSKLPNAKGDSIDKMPDLTFYLSFPREGISQPDHDALFFECKVLGKGKDMSGYGGSGIKRFVDSQYAWKMSHAGMIAYDLTRSKSDPLSKLTSYLKNPKVKKSGLNNWDELQCRNVPSGENSDHLSSQEVICSVHSRPVLANEEIVLRHLWLSNSC